MVFSAKTSTARHKLKKHCLRELAYHKQEENAGADTTGESAREKKLRLPQKEGAVFDKADKR
ncbi:MAG: hypothetical protein IKN64_10675 [Desulfovibrio sp.]|nr:hypothetical protein [Desulfovibrio sp.]